MITLNDLSERRLAGVHPDLVAVVRRAAQSTDAPFLVVEGLRTVKRQKELVGKGASKTMDSRHLTGHAVDLAAFAQGNTLAWGKPHSHDLASSIKAAANELSVDLEWGGDWKSFVDTPHFQLSRASYPKQDTSWKGAPAGEGVPGPVATAVKESKTIWGGLLAMFGAVLQFFNDAAAGVATFASESLTAIGGLDPIAGLANVFGANVSAVGFGLATVGVVTVISRRVNAAIKGKIG